MNIVLIAIDTLRSDALSCYGNPRPTTPNIDRLAEGGVLFENFYSVGNCTHPGFTSMITGLFPESTGVISHWTKVPLSQEVPTMAQLFADAGFVTAAIDNLYDGWRPKNPFYPWFRRGYSYYDYPRAEGFYQPGSEVSRMACEWLASVPRQPFLLFVHYWDTHAPYNKAPPGFYRFYDGDDPCDPRLDYMPHDVRERQRRVFGRPLTDPRYVEAAYHAEAAYADECIGQVVSKIKELRLQDDTTLVITSDHGDIMTLPRMALGRLWAFCHIGLNEDCLRVPLVISGLGVGKGVRVAERFQLVDILPTLLELGEVSGKGDGDGRSLVPALLGDDLTGREELCFSENTYQKQRAILSWPWKYMRMEADYNSMPRRSLYSLDEDPLETRNVSDVEVDVVGNMDLALDEYVTRTTRGGPDPMAIQDVTSWI